MISGLRLQNFRSYQDESFEFESGVNIIVGPNASGKTNLLEALLVVATGSSYRATDKELVAFDAPWARLDSFGAKNRTIKLEVQNEAIKKSYVFDEKDYKILNFDHTLPVVVFEPDHLRLLHGMPDDRRNYIDDLIEQIEPNYHNIRKQYRRVLAQRNRLLKSPKTPKPDQLFVWNLRISELGGAIVNQRIKYIDKLNETLDQLYSSIAGTKGQKVSITYKTKLPLNNYETTLLKALESSYDKDIERGHTTCGPHRDDFEISFNNHPASEVASRGEIRTVLLSLKIHELNVLEEHRGQKPLLLLDDVFSELDGKRRHSLTSYLENNQVFITTTDADAVLDKKILSSNIIPLS